MDQKEIQKKLKAHKKWYDSEFKIGQPADFEDKDLRGVDLSKAFLSLASFMRANLENANLREINLVQAELMDINLKNATILESNLQKATLTDANLEGANLEGANLSESELFHTNLINANLKGVNLQKANLEEANLTGANLEGANLEEANLLKTILKGANLQSCNMRRAHISEINLDDTVIEETRCEHLKIDIKTANKFPNEIQNLYRYSWDIRNAEGKPINIEPIIHSVEFPPEHHQAVVEVLSYFGKILHDKYPPKTFKFRVEQGDFRASMIIETDTEHRESIINTLDEYGQVLTGSIAPEEFTENKLQLVEIKRLLQHLSDYQNELSTQISAQNETFLPIIKQLTQGKTAHYIEKSEYAVYISDSTGIGAERRPEKEKTIRARYFKKKESYDIFVYQTSVEKKAGTGKKEFESIELDRSLLNLLILFLKYKDRPLPYLKLYHKAWEGGAHYNYKANDPLEVVDSLKAAVHLLRKAFKDVEGFKIPKASGGTYTCKGKFKFCLILDKHFDETYTLEGV